MAVNFDIFFRGNSTSFEAASQRVLTMGDKVAAKLNTSIGQKLGQYFSAGAMLLYARGIVNFADEITDMSSRLEVSTQTLQEWGYAAERNGSKLSAVTKFFEALSVAREKALGGDADAQGAFGRLGVNDSMLRTQGNSAIALAVANAVRGGSSQELLGPLKEIGGKGVGELIPAMKSGIQELGEEARSAGRILDDEMLAQLKTFKNELMNIRDIFKGPMATAIGFASDQLRNMVDFTKIVAGGIGSIIGSILGGASWKEVKQITSEFMNEVADERLRRDRAIQAQADQQKNAEQRFDRTIKDRVIDMTPKVDKRDTSSVSVSGWQKLGAAVRLATEAKQIMLLQRIERNTALTAENIRPKAGSVLQGGFGSGFGP